jgi:thiamine biosynthesis lipoprotein ApbE
LAAVATASATDTDALSTALLVLGREGWTQIIRARPGLRALLVTRAGARLERLAHGLDAATPAERRPRLERRGERD